MDDRGLAGRNVLVTGATGFLGTHLARALVLKGARVHALRTRAQATTRLPCDSLIWHQGDVTDLESLRLAAQSAQPEIVFHLAAYGTGFHQQDNELAYRTNVAGSWNLWTALEGIDCRLVHAGTCGEYGRTKGQVTEQHVCRPTWFYPATKNASVVLLSTLGKQFNREVVALRPFGPYGPGDDPSRIIPSVILSLLKGQEIQVTAGEQLRDYAHVSDHVTAFLLAGTQPIRELGLIYNIGSGEVFTLRHIMETIAETVGPEASRLIKFGALPYRDSEVWEMCGDITAARRDLNYQPRIPLAEGLAETVEWYRSHPQQLD